MAFRIFSFIVLAFAITSCATSKDDKAGIDLFTSASDFDDSQNDWHGGFADYCIADSASYKFQFSYTGLPTNLNASQKAIMVGGTNLGDNLFMYIKKKLDGLNANTVYTLAFDVELASDVQEGIANADSVKLKVGATPIEPKAIKQNSYYRMNIDKGKGGIGGNDMIVVGTIGIADSLKNYNLINKGNSLSYASPYTYFKASTNSQGELWLIVGTDSSYKGTTTVYYTKVNVVLSVSK